MSQAERLRLQGCLDGVPDDPESRRKWLREARDSDPLAWLRAAVGSWQATALADAQWIAELVGAPVAEVAASPLGLRACALGAEVGAALVHHELRPQWRWDPDLLPDAGAADELHGQWRDGVLHAGRFEGFCQDQPLAGFNPNHSARWTPHELLHRACGFAWRPGVSKWWLYGAARLGEVLPVAHWYGTDAVFRLDGDGFDEREDIADPRASLQRAQWLTTDVDKLLLDRGDAAIAGLRAAARWLDDELDAVRREQAEGVTVHVADALLDSVSDATAYVAGHHRRLAHPFVAEVLGTMAIPGAHRHDTHEAFRRHVRTLFDRLVFGAIALDRRAIGARRAGRLLWDLALSAAHADPVTAQEALGEQLERGREAVVQAWSGDGRFAEELLPEWVERLQDAALDDVLPLGLCTELDPLPATPRIQLSEGIASATPMLAEALGWQEGVSVAELDALHSERLFVRGPLVQRLAEWAEADAWGEASVDAAVLSLAIAGASRGDDVIERLCWDGPVPAEPGAQLKVRKNAEFSACAAHGGVLVGRFRGAVSVVPLAPNVRRLWRALDVRPVVVDEALDLLAPVLGDAMDPEWPTEARRWLEELREAGAIGVLG